MAINVAEKYNLDMTGGSDNSDKLATMAADIAAIHAAKKPMPLLVFSEGVVLFDHWPNLAYDGLKIFAEGECILRHTGKGHAVNFDGPAIYPGDQGGPDGLQFEGFIIEPTMNGGHGFVINSCHRSRFDVFVRLTSGPTTTDFNAAINMVFGILTEIRPRVNGHKTNCIGLAFDSLPNRPDLPPTANRISLPILEGCEWGTYLAAAAYTNFYDGSIEGCGTGIEIDDGGNNHFIMVEMEGNKNYDAVTTAKAHDNLFWHCGEGHPSKFKSSFAGWNNRLEHGPLDGLFGL
jgi:hypothetical protein